MNRPPELKDLLLPAFLTILRSKKFNGEIYTAQEKFIISSIQSKKLLKYKQCFGFKRDIPLSYFYLLSQRVQSSLMVNKKFPLPIPGLIHLNSKLSQYSEASLHEPIEITSKVELKNKKEGSLLPVFKESYYQNGKKIVEIESCYLLRRKSKRKKTSRKKDPIINKVDSNWISEKWKFKRKDSMQYAKISGDYNPIHILTLFAWVSGFKARIIHGWYSTSMAVAHIENETQMPVKSIEVNFLGPITIPSQVKFEFRLSSDRNFQFKLKRDKEEAYAVSGYIS